MLLGFLVLVLYFYYEGSMSRLLSFISITALTTILFSDEAQALRYEGHKQELNRRINKFVGVRPIDVEVTPLNLKQKPKVYKTESDIFLATIAELKNDEVDSAPESYKKNDSIFDTIFLVAEERNQDAHHFINVIRESLVRGNNPSQNKKYFSKLNALAQKNNRTAMFNIGYCFEAEIGCLQSDPEAFKWYKRAAKLGDRDAMNSLGYAYELGVGHTNNDQKAFMWYKKAADLGDPCALHNLASSFEDGRGCEPDGIKAFELYKKAAELEQPDAMYKLGIFCESGIYCPQDKVEAFNWFKKAADLGQPDAINKLGLFYELGVHFSKDKATAFKCYKRAAELGQVESMYSLGCFYELGIGHAQNEQKAFKWYSKAVEYGQKKAYTRLGYCIEKGIGCVKSGDIALGWYKLAEEQGDKEVLQLLAFLYFNGMEGVPRDPEKALFYLNQIKETHKVNHYIGEIYLGKGEYQKALDNFIIAKRNGEIVADRLIQMLEKRTRKTKSSFVPPQPKQNTAKSKNNRFRKAAKESIRKDIMNKKQEAISLYNKLSSLLRNDEFVSACKELGFNPDACLKEISDPNEVDSKPQNESLIYYDNILSKLNDVEEKFIICETKMNNKKRVEEFQNALLGQRNNDYSPMGLMTQSDQRQARKEALDAAWLTDSAQKRKAIKKQQKPETPSTNFKPKKSETSRDTLEDEKYVAKPFARAKTIYDTTTEFDKKIKDKVKALKYAIRSAEGEGEEAMNDAIKRLKAVPGKKKFKKIKNLEYAGVPGATVVYQLRVNDQFRVVVPFRQFNLFEPSPDAVANNNNLGKEVCELYNNTIIVKDPHKK